MNLPDARVLHNQYIVAQPFPHMVFKNIFDPDILKKAAKEFNGCETKKEWKAFKKPETCEHKYAKHKDFKKHSQYIINQLKSKKFIGWLQKLTGSRNLLYDEGLGGAGLHAVATEGFLKIHVDFNLKTLRIGKDKIEAVRKINVLLYLNKDWKTIWGGDLELWNSDLTFCVQKIMPKLGTLVIFEASEISYHGHPQPLHCPYGEYRKSIATYYYVKKSSGYTTDPHGTLYQSIDGGRR